MSRIQPVVDHAGQHIGWEFFCPGCQTKHSVSSHGWRFNQDADKPTFSPSILVQSGHYIKGHQGDCWCDYNANNPNDPGPFKCIACHSFVEEGMIRFLSDSTHELRGRSIELPNLSGVC